MFPWLQWHFRKAGADTAFEVLFLPPEWCDLGGIYHSTVSPQQPDVGTGMCGAEPADQGHAALRAAAATAWPAALATEAMRFKLELGGQAVNAG